MVDASRLLLLVVGGHLRAEMADRPEAYRMQDRINHWLRRHRGVLNVAITPLVCSDLWYLNHEELHQRPTISIGGPGVNLLAAHFARHLPEAAAKQQVVIQIDPEFTDLRVLIWGSNHDLTVKGLDLFINQYLEGYLRAVASQVEPYVE